MSWQVIAVCLTAEPLLYSLHLGVNVHGVHSAVKGVVLVKNTAVYHRHLHILLGAAIYYILLYIVD